MHLANKALIRTEQRVCYFTTCPTCGTEVDLEHSGATPRTDDVYICVMCLRDITVTWETEE